MSCDLYLYKYILISITIERFFNSFNDTIFTACKALRFNSLFNSLMPIFVILSLIWFN